MASAVMAKLFVLAALLPLICSAFSPDRPTDGRVLVLVDNLAIQSSHSVFFASLQSRGFHLDFKLADPNLSPFSSPPQRSVRNADILNDIRCFGGSLDSAAVLEFVDSGRDLILAADSSASHLIREIASECGVDFDEDPAAMVIDHTGYAISEAEGDHTLIASDDFIKSNVILGEKNIEAPVLFRGIGHSLNAATSLVLKVLSPSSSAYSANPNTRLSSPPSLTGTAISLVSIMQARNNARILISGSLEMFSNKFSNLLYKIQGSLLGMISQAMSNLLLRSANRYSMKGVISSLPRQAVHIRHQKVGEISEYAIYRINDDLEYSVEIYEWSESSWKPYIADDVQVQFYMMSPYILKTLSHDQKGLYSTSFKIPDVYGVFQFKVEYQKLGYTSLSLSKQIPVRPFKHNEYERFITTAFPYYGASFSTMAAFFIFTVVYLYSK